MMIDGDWFVKNRLWFLSLLVALGVGFFAGHWRRPTYHYHSVIINNHEFRYRTEDPSGKTWMFSDLGEWVR